MFKVTAQPEFVRTVTVPLPEGDAQEEHTFRARFRLTNDYDPDAIVTRDGMKAFLRRAVVGLDDVVDDAGTPLPFSPELLEQVLAFDAARLALMRTYSRETTALKTGN